MFRTARGFILSGVLFALIVAYRYSPDGWHYLPLVGTAIWLSVNFTVKAKRKTGRKLTQGD